MAAKTVGKKHKISVNQVRVVKKVTYDNQIISFDYVHIYISIIYYQKAAINKLSVAENKLIS